MLIWNLLGLTITAIYDWKESRSMSVLLILSAGYSGQYFYFGLLNTAVSFKMRYNKYLLTPFPFRKGCSLSFLDG